MVNGQNCILQDACLSGEWTKRYKDSSGALARILPYHVQRTSPSPPSPISPTPMDEQCSINSYIQQPMTRQVLTPTTCMMKGGSLTVPISFSPFNLLLTGVLWGGVSWCSLVHDQIGIAVLCVVHALSRNGWHPENLDRAVSTHKV